VSPSHPSTEFITPKVMCWSQRRDHFQFCFRLCGAPVGRQYGEGHVSERPVEATLPNDGLIKGNSSGIMENGASIRFDGSVETTLNPEQIRSARLNSSRCPLASFGSAPVSQFSMPRPDDDKRTDQADRGNGQKGPDRSPASAKHEIYNRRHHVVRARRPTASPGTPTPLGPARSMSGRAERE
jgi:hypothetical protein